MSDANLGDGANGLLSDRARSGYAVEVCRCEEGAYLGARKAGTPCRCERCGFMTADQLAAIVREHAERAWDEALRHVWALNDPAYTVITDTESIHPILTRSDVEQATNENPYRQEQDR